MLRMTAVLHTLYKQKYSIYMNVCIDSMYINKAKIHSLNNVYLNSMSIHDALSNKACTNTLYSNSQHTYLQRYFSHGSQTLTIQIAETHILKP